MSTCPTAFRAAFSVAAAVLAAPLLLTGGAVRAQDAPAAAAPAPPAARNVPALADVFGTTPGEDRKLLAWADVLRGFRELERIGGGRVEVFSPGRATEGAPYVFAVITSPENQGRMAALRAVQDRLADPRGLRAGEEKPLLELGRNVVVITCGVHSTEVASTLAGCRIAYRLATGDDAEVKRILDQCVVVLAPSINPDGVDIVKNWYDRSLGTPWEGSGPPRLYQKYVGHDDNRDWVAFTQAETRLTVDSILNVYKPQILHDIHQMGATGPRLFLPPYTPPVEPNVAPELIEGYTTLGRAVQADLTGKGYAGVATNALFDGWTPLRAYAHYHHGIRILSETASARLASPLEIGPNQIAPRWREASADFPLPWGGGTWTVGKAADYMTAAAFSLLTHAAENREAYLRRYLTVAKRAVAAPAPGQRAAILLPPAPNRPALLSILRRAGVEVTLSETEFRATPPPAREKPGEKGKERKFPKGTAVVRADQPYFAFAAATLLPGRYPDLTDAGGRPVEPYDVTAHCLSLLMDVPAVEAVAPFETPNGTPVGAADTFPVARPAGIPEAAQTVRLAVYQSWVSSMDEGWTRFMLEQCGIPYQTLHDADVRAGATALRARFDAILVADQSPRALRDGHAPNRMPGEYTGGLGVKGAAALRAFAEAGGTLVFLNKSSRYAIRDLGLPVRDVTEGADSKTLFLPGSILRVEMERRHPLAKGVRSSDALAWVEGSPVFEADPAAAKNAVKVVARYPKKGDLLLSGWLRGGGLLAGKAALVEVSVGKGRCVLFGFRPQYRGQSYATYPLLGNAIARR